MRPECPPCSASATSDPAHFSPFPRIGGRARGGPPAIRSIRTSLHVGSCRIFDQRRSSPSSQAASSRVEAPPRVHAHRPLGPGLIVGPERPPGVEIAARPHDPERGGGGEARRRRGGRRTGGRPADSARPARRPNHRRNRTPRDPRRPADAAEARPREQDERPGQPLADDVQLDRRRAATGPTPSPSPGPASGRPRGSDCRSASGPSRDARRRDASASSDSPTNSGSNPTTACPRSSNAFTRARGRPSGRTRPALPRGWATTVSRPVDRRGVSLTTGMRSPRPLRRLPCGRSRMRRGSARRTSSATIPAAVGSTIPTRTRWIDSITPRAACQAAASSPGDSAAIAPVRSSTSDLLQLVRRREVVGRRMILVEDEQVLGRLDRLLPLAGRRAVLDVQEPAGHECVDRVAARLVVIVREVEDLGRDAIRDAEQLVHTANRRIGVGHRRGRPVARGPDELHRPGRGQRGDLDVVGAEPHPGQFSQTQPPCSSQDPPWRQLRGVLRT